MFKSKLYPYLILLILFSFQVSCSDLVLVTRVIDGDTFVIQTGERVRLIGVDTPETVHPSKPIEYYGKEASNFTKKLIEGKKVRLESDVQERDRYRRLLAYVFLEDGTFLNAELLKQGFAQVLTIPPNVKYAEIFLEIQKEARENNRGLWAKKEEQKTSDNITKSSADPDLIVYITKTGTKYHREGCRFLDKSKIPIPLKEASQKYEPCSVCKPPVCTSSKQFGQIQLKVNV